jgi:hypothetical protein
MRGAAAPVTTLLLVLPVALCGLAGARAEERSTGVARTPEDVDRWVKVMDEVGVEKTVLLTGATGAEFDRIVDLYSRHPTRFELWCGLDYTGQGRRLAVSLCWDNNYPELLTHYARGGGAEIVLMPHAWDADALEEEGRVIDHDSMEEIVAYRQRTGRMRGKTHDGSEQLVLATVS